MDNNNRIIKLNDRVAIKYAKFVLIAVLVIIEIFVCAQYYSKYMDGSNSKLVMVCVVFCCAILAVMESLQAFVIKRFVVRMVFYGTDSVLLLIICLLTGNSYLSTLYCIVLSLYYLAVEEFKPNTILFAVSCVLFVISFVCGWIAVNRGTSIYESVVQVLGDCIFGLFILGMHYAIFNFLLKYYNTNENLRVALREADESKAQLKSLSDQLLSTAVYEERNRIARDIHDNAGHSMTAVIMQTEAAKLLVDTNPEEAKNRIISANIQAKNALDQMRESVHLLAGRNSIRSLKEEVEEIIAQTMDGCDIKVRCDLEDVQADASESRYILNTIKECLANGIRHGKATAFYVELKEAFSEINLLISDNGCGIDGEICEGFGLKGIRENAKALGGNCSFSSESGEGFEVDITLPKKEDRSKDI
jgi:signal transduction histidine kinase